MKDDDFSVRKLVAVALGFGVFVIGMALVVGQLLPQKVDSSISTAVVTPLGVTPLGGTAHNGNWEMTLFAFAPYSEYTNRAPSPPPQGQLMVISFSVANRGKATSTINPSDFKIQSADGRTFSTASRSLDKSLSVLQQVQPGLSTENRLTFDLDPAAQGLTLTALGMKFKLMP